MSFRIFLFPVAAVLAACNGPASDVDVQEGHTTPGVLTAKTLGEQVVLPTADYLELPEYRDADPEYGTRLAMQCRACHSFEPDGPAIAGPNLHGIFGKPVAAATGFPYSPALAAADFIWTPLALDAWLAAPQQFLPGNRMAYPGLREADDRNALIAALLRLTTDDGVRQPGDD
jgi:cytochrome c